MDEKASQPTTPPASAGTPPITSSPVKPDKPQSVSATLDPVKKSSGMARVFILLFILLDLALAGYILYRLLMSQG